MLRNTFLLLALCGLAVSARAQDAKLETELQKFSYGMGMQIAGQLRGANIPELDNAAFIQGLSDMLAGKQPALELEEIKAAFQAVAARRQEAANAEQEKVSEVAEANKAAGAAFMAKNKSADGVQSLDSGIQYKVVTAATGPKPTATSTVVVHYRGRLLDGTEFDSSYSRNQPAEFRLDAVIKGWQEVVAQMSPGASWTVWIPADLAYGERGAGAKIGPNETLNFDIELIEIKG